MNAKPPSRQRLQIHRYQIWGIAYLILFALTSPALPWGRHFVTFVVLPSILNFHAAFLASFVVFQRGYVEQHFIFQILFCNLVLIAFSMAETFLRGNKVTRFDIIATFVLGAAAFANVLMFLFIYTGIELLYFTCGFSIVYVLLDIGGIVHSSKVEVEQNSAFKYSLAFVDAPTLFVCLAFLVPIWMSSVTYPHSFTDGIGAGILLFSGLAWISVMVFFVAPRAGIPTASDKLGDKLATEVSS